MSGSRTRPVGDAEAQEASGRQAAEAAVRGVAPPARSVASETDHRVASAVFETTREGVMVTDADNRITSVNRAFTAITGYSPEEVVGRDPSFLGSGRHDSGFFRGMWEALLSEGHWEGEIWNRRKNGEIFPSWFTTKAVRDTEAQVDAFIAVFSDIGGHPTEPDDKRTAARFDPLTELPNEQSLQDHIHRAIATARQTSQKAAILCVDIDRFRRVNETFGYGVGDLTLLTLANRLQGCVKEFDSVGRIGSDDFLVLLPSISDANDCAKVARRIIDVLSKPMTISGHADITVTASVGVACYPDDGETPKTLIRNAGTAAEEAVAAGGGIYHFFTPVLQERSRLRLTQENKLKHAIEAEQLILHYQPKVELRQGRIIGCEALVRWLDPDEGLIPPGRFIPLAEDTGLIVPLGEWVLREAARQAVAWQEAGLPMIRMAVNISARQLPKRGLLDDIANILEDTGLAPSNLEIEITESSLMERAEDAILTLSKLRELGVYLAADDFGTGYSSLSYLRTFPLNAIKIDRSFVADIGSGQEGAMLAAAVIALGQSMNLQVIAEGVEDRAQVAFLRQQWCDQIQGFLFSPPVPADEFEKMLREDKRF